MWRWVRRLFQRPEVYVDRPTRWDIDEVIAAQKIQREVAHELRCTLAKQSEVDRVVAESELLRARNHFGEQIEQAFRRKPA